YLSIAGFGGFDLNDFSKSYYGGGIEGKLFKSLYKFTFGARAKVGHVIDNGGLYSYSVGGMSTVRGYDFGERKGDSTLLFNAELAFELIKQPLPIDFFIFYDIGNADNNYSKLMNNTISSAGIGAKVTVPMLGQIRFEYLYKINENKWVGSFGFGPVF
nr:ShlB/FhaC/HecB family hemolysin secretion/activation protein [Petrotogaceae bacterium]